jgi:putative hydrolase of the HAD superfamily
MIQAVFFDMYGTLSGFKPSRFEIQNKACSEFGIKLTEDDTIKGYADADAYMTQQNAILPLRLRSSTDVFEFFQNYERKVIAGSGIEVGNELAGHIWESVRSIPYDMVLFDDVIDVLESLKNMKIITGLISNMNQPSSSLLDKFALNDYIDFAVTSHEVGSEKPHPPIFLEALKRSGCNGKDTVHVGDQLGSDVEGAIKSGIQPVLLDRDGIHLGYDKCPRIRKLDQLLPILDLLA